MKSGTDNMHLIWCHGSLAQPWGAKSTAMAEAAAAEGMTMEAPDFRDIEDPDLRVERLVALLTDLDGPAIIAGSSMGGYVAATAARQADVRGLFLMAPAFYFPGYAVHVFSGLPETITVVHGWNDDVVPVENSIRFGGLHSARLHILPDGHRLSDSLEDIVALFTHFLKTVRENA